MPYLIVIPCWATTYFVFSRPALIAQSALRQVSHPYFSSDEHGSEISDTLNNFISPRSQFLITVTDCNVSQRSLLCCTQDEVVVRCSIRRTGYQSSEIGHWFRTTSHSLRRGIHRIYKSVKRGYRSCGLLNWEGRLLTPEGSIALALKGQGLWIRYVPPKRRWSITLPLSVMTR